MDFMDSFKYCFSCGSGDIKKQGNRINCQRCALEYYENPKPATAVLLNNSRGEYLLTERAAEPAKGKWDLPGGFVDGGEDMEQGIRREVKEELGIDIQDLEYIGTEHDLYEFKGIVYKIVGATYRGRIDDDVEIKPADDVAGYKLFLPKDFPMDDIAFPAIKQILERLRTAS